jgi:TIR domain
MSYTHDVFISHASEDKTNFVRPLADALSDVGLSVWYDDWELKPGQSLVERINEGLGGSRFGVLVLSPAFFAKDWPRAELNALAALEMHERRDVLVPIWLGLGTDEIAKYAPLLLARVALQADEGVEVVAAKIGELVQADAAGSPTVGVAPTKQTLTPNEVMSKALPNTYCNPVEGPESTFIVRSIAALDLGNLPEAFLSSQQKRAFEAICADSAIERLVQSLVGRPGLHPPPSWGQATPTGVTIMTASRPPEALAVTGGTIEVRGVLGLHNFLDGTAHAYVHADVVFKPPETLRARSLLSLDDLYQLLIVSGAAVRNELAPVVGATLAANDSPRLLAQSVVATAYRSDFATYLDLSAYTKERATGAHDPTGVHWNGKTMSEVEPPAAWRRTIIGQIDRLFSSGGFLDYEETLERLAGIVPVS